MTLQSPFAASPLLAHVAGLSRADLEKLQLTKLRRQLDRLYAQSPYYRDRMDGTRLKPESIVEPAEVGDGAVLVGCGERAVDPHSALAERAFASLDFHGIGIS